MNVVFLQHQGNSIDPLHQFHYIEHEQNGQIAFLDTLISRNNCSISIDVYRKPTHTNRYLAKTKQKISTVTTLNSYPRKLITSLIVKQERKKVTPSPEELVRTFFETIERTLQHKGYAILPYIKGLTEPLQRTVSKHDIKVFSKHLKTLQATARVSGP